MSDSRQVIASIFDSVSDFTLQTFIKIPEGESVASAAKKMLGCKCTEAIICGGKDIPIGIVTGRDVLYRVVASGRDPSTTKVSEVMSSPIETIEENVGIGEALLRMTDL